MWPFSSAKSEPLQDAFFTTYNKANQLDQLDDERFTIIPMPSAYAQHINDVCTVVGSTFLTNQLNAENIAAEGHIMDAMHSIYTKDEHGKTGFIVAVADGVGGHCGDLREDKAIATAAHTAAIKSVEYLAEAKTPEQLQQALHPVAARVSNDVKAKDTFTTSSSSLLACRAFAQDEDFRLVGFNIGDATLCTWNPREKTFTTIVPARRVKVFGGWDIASVPINVNTNAHEIFSFDVIVPAGTILLPMTDAVLDALPTSSTNSSKDNKEYQDICLDRKFMTNLFRKLDEAAPASAYMEALIDVIKKGTHQERDHAIAFHPARNREYRVGDDLTVTIMRTPLPLYEIIALLRPALESALVDEQGIYSSEQLKKLKAVKNRVLLQAINMLVAEKINGHARYLPQQHKAMLGQLRALLNRNVASFDEPINMQVSTKELLAHAVNNKQYLLLTALIKQHDINLINDDGDNLLQLAIKNDDLFLFNMVLKFGIDVYHKNSSEQDALDLSVQAKNSAMIQALSSTLLQRPIHAGDLALTEALLTRGADPDCCDNTGRTPLMHAVIQKQQQIVSLLLTKSIDRLRHSAGGETALHYAVQAEGDSHVVWQLLDNVELKAQQALLLAGDIDGRTALFIAATTNNLSLVKYLLELAQSAELQATDYINVLNRYNYSPLHILVREGMHDMAQFLIQHGAAVNVRNLKNNLTPVEMARKCAKDDIARYIYNQPNYKPQIPKEEKEQWQKLKEFVKSDLELPKLCEFAMEKNPNNKAIYVRFYDRYQLVYHTVYENTEPEVDMGERLLLMADLNYLIAEVKTINEQVDKRSQLQDSEQQLDIEAIKYHKKFCHNMIMRLTDLDRINKLQTTLGPVVEKYGYEKLKQDAKGMAAETKPEKVAQSLKNLYI